MRPVQHLKQTFEATIKVGLFPRSQIDIFVEVLQVRLRQMYFCIFVFLYFRIFVFPIRRQTVETTARA